jgi:hypothetical protein
VNIFKKLTYNNINSQKLDDSVQWILTIVTHPCDTHTKKLYENIHDPRNILVYLSNSHPIYRQPLSDFFIID